MKKIAIIGLLSVCAAGAYAQGTLNFADNIPGSSLSQIYSPNTANPTVETTGNTSSQFPTGTQTYPTGQYTPIGGSSGTGLNYAFGNQFTVQVYFAAGKNQPLASLQPATAYIGTMATAANPGAGYMSGVTLNPDPGLFGLAQALADADPNRNATLDNTATVALACWYNANNTITSLAAASAAKVPYGESAKINMSNLGETATVESVYNGTTTQAQQPQYMQITSFSLIQPVPEPSTIALGVLGVCAFLARRKKS
jgi:hypothetical protein